MTPEERRNEKLSRVSERITNAYDKLLKKGSVDPEVLDFLLALVDQQNIRNQYIEEKLQDISETLNKAVLRNILK